MISETMLGIRLGFALSFSNWSGNWLRASTPPLMEFRVVSLPPTISRTRLPKNSIGRSIKSLVSSLLCSIVMRSKPGSSPAARRASLSRHRALSPRAASTNPRKTLSLSEGPPLACSMELARSDHSTSLRRWS